MRSVPTMSIEQQDMQALHRVRARRVAERTDLGNQIRGLLLEFGIAVGRSSKIFTMSSFNGPLRDDCLNANQFVSIDDARHVIEAWPKDYSRYRPHGHRAN